MLNVGEKSQFIIIFRPTEQFKPCRPSKSSSFYRLKFNDVDTGLLPVTRWESKAVRKSMQAAEFKCPWLPLAPIKYVINTVEKLGEVSAFDVDTMSFVENFED